MDNQKTNNKTLLLTIGIILTILIIGGGTLAYWSWTTNESERTNIVFTLEQDFACAVDGGGDITETDAFIAPTSCTNSEHAIMREVTVTPSIYRDGLTIDMDLWIEVKSLDTGLKNSDNFKYAFTTSSTSCDTDVVATGNLKGLTTGSQVPILEKSFSSSTPETYYLWIWLDNAETSSDTMAQSFSLTLGGQCTDDVEYQSEALTCTLSVTDSGIGFDTYSSGVVSTGLSTSSTETYNDTEILALSVGTKYGYVKDASGNTGSCSVEITTTTTSSSDTTWACDDYYYEYAVNECVNNYGGTITSNSCSRSDLYDKITYTCVVEDFVITCEDGTVHYLTAEEYNNAQEITGALDNYCMDGGEQIGYEISGGNAYWEERDYNLVTLANCTTETNYGCDEDYVGTTYSSCDSSYIGGYDYSGSVICRMPVYVCDSGYEKLNNSYCYLNK